MLVDMPLTELKKYKPAQNKQSDFSEFWKETIEISKSMSLDEEINKIDYMIKGFDANKVYYNGFKGSRICGYYLTPNGVGPFPAILFFHGYGGSKQKINHYLKWIFMGYAVLAVDVRGQSGESVDAKIYPPPSVPGYMTKGIFSKKDYYYRGVYMDCVRAIDFLSRRKEINIKRLCITGGSQGGGLTLSTAALDNRPKLAIAEIPYLCHYRRAVEWSEEIKNMTYLEFIFLIKAYPERENEMFKVLSYFDNLNLCSWIKARTVVTCAMKDTVCPPSTIFAVFNHIKTQKHMEIMPYYEHDYEAIMDFEEKKLEYIKNYL